MRTEAARFPPQDNPTAQGNKGTSLGSLGIPSPFLNRLRCSFAIRFLCVVQGMKASTAEYWLLKEVSNLETFGQEMFHSKFGYNGVSMIGVGPHGITVYRSHNEETQKYVQRSRDTKRTIKRAVPVLGYLDLPSVRNWRSNEPTHIRCVIVPDKACVRRALGSSKNHRYRSAIHALSRLGTAR